MTAPMKKFCFDGEAPVDLRQAREIFLPIRWNRREARHHERHEMKNSRRAHAKNPP
jgi:hypothetical protein